MVQGEWVRKKKKRCGGKSERGRNWREIDTSAIDLSANLSEKNNFGRKESFIHVLFDSV
jgi:hypothetical protein